eukprot:622084-Pleurochrysis_carterae.AAC.1
MRAPALSLLPRRVAHAHAARMRTRTAQTHAACVRERCPFAPTRPPCARSALASAHSTNARGMRGCAMTVPCPDASHMRTQRACERA